MTRPILVGLTGGLASGKTTVAGLLAERGCRVVDADQLVAALYRPGEPGAAAIRELFGEAVLTSEGGVDHPTLATRVFPDPAARRQVEEVIHPLVRERFRQIAESASEDVVVLEATLLVEAGYVPDFDLILVVEAPESARLERAVRRGLAEDDARRRLAAQGGGATRREAADVVIVNDGSLADLAAKVDDVLRHVRSQGGGARAARNDG